jgi:hypothetical protein
MEQVERKLLTGSGALNSLSRMKSNDTIVPAVSRLMVMALIMPRKHCSVCERDVASNANVLNW